MLEATCSQPVQGGGSDIVFAQTGLGQHAEEMGQDPEAGNRTQAVAGGFDEDLEEGLVGPCPLPALGKHLLGIVGTVCQRELMIGHEDMVEPAEPGGQVEVAVLVQDLGFDAA